MRGWAITQWDRRAGVDGLVELTVRPMEDGTAYGFAAVKVPYGTSGWVMHYLFGISDASACKIQLEAYADQLGDVRPILALLGAFARESEVAP